VVAVTVFNANPLGVSGPLPGTYCSYGPRAGFTVANGDNGLVTPDPDSAVTSPVNIVWDGNRGFVQLTNRSLGYLAAPLSASGGSSGTFLQTGARPTGLAIGNGAIVGAWTGTFNKSPVSTTSLATPNSIDSNNVSGWDTARPVAMVGSSVVTATLEGGTSWVYSMTQTGTSLGAAAPVAAPSSAIASFVTPVVGTGNRVYVVRGDGMLVAYDGLSVGGIANQAPAWNGALFTSSTTVLAHPTLDCSRNGGALGTLYVVSQDGRVTAVIVDSAKLETSSPWPKWQRTAGNSGNTSFPLNPGCP
jgi:hypothetical protein